MVAPLEMLLRNERLNSFGRNCLETQQRTNNRTEEDINQSYERLLGLGFNEKTIAAAGQSILLDADMLEENYKFLRSVGLSHRKIEKNFFLIARNNQTLRRNYQHHLGLLIQDPGDEKQARKTLSNHPPLLGVSPDTFDANVHWLRQRDISTNNGLLLGVKPHTRRTKLAWMLRELFGYRQREGEDKKKAIAELYSFVRDDPDTLILSLPELERRKEELLRKKGTATTTYLRNKGITSWHIKRYPELQKKEERELADAFSFFETLGLDEKAIARNPQLLCADLDEARRTYGALLYSGLGPEDIQRDPKLLLEDPEEVDRINRFLVKIGASEDQRRINAPLYKKPLKDVRANYDKVLAALAEDSGDTKEAKRSIAQATTLLRSDPETIEANIQWYSARGIDFKYASALATKVHTKRLKLSWIVREILGYDPTNKNERSEVLKRAYEIVREDPHLLVKSLKELKKQKDRIRERYGRLN